VIVLVFLESVVAEIAPEYGGHAEFVSLGKGLADLHNLSSALIGAEIDRRAHGGCAHVIGFLHRAEQDLVGSIREG
jgi:hypothetical protein